MDTNEYQRLAARTLVERPDFVLTDDEILLVWKSLGLAGEAGEVAELVKKGVLHRHELDRDQLFKELGDTAWYLAAVCTIAGFDLDDVLSANIEKLKKRYPDGYSHEDSMNRADTEGT